MSPISQPVCHAYFTKACYRNLNDVATNHGKSSSLFVLEGTKMKNHNNRIVGGIMHKVAGESGKLWNPCAEGEVSNCFKCFDLTNHAVSSYKQQISFAYASVMVDSPHMACLGNRNQFRSQSLKVLLMISWGKVGCYYD